MARVTAPLDLFAAASERPDALALRSDEGVELTFAELSARAAGFLSRVASPAPGARVAVHATNRASTFVALHALVAARVPFVLLHPRLAPAQSAALVLDSGCELALDDEALRALCAPTEAALSVTTTTSSSSSSSSSSNARAPLAVLYTSGSSGAPKGAVLSRRAFAASAAASERALELTERDRWVLALPVCHIGGLSVLTRCLAARCPVLLHARFDADRVLESIVRDGATVLSVVPTMLHALLERDARNALARSRVVLVGGAGCPRALLEECARRGVPARTTYGLTEACSQATVQRASAPSIAAVRDDSGEALEGVSLRIVRPDGAPCAAGEEGSIQLAGPTLFDGYLHHEPRDPSAHFDTGDLGFLDEMGALTVLARRTDLVVTGGENVYPAQVERALEALPGVARALVFGEPDERWGQRVCAVLVTREGYLGEEATARALRERLARFACPRSYALARDEEIPMLASGKVHRRALSSVFAPRLRPVDAR